ncbi:MAG: hypothetical protein KDA61_04850, partial [Planctomycetales bacterium]|nr:hypothetical protein [Planctomycetales bacterium]
GWWATLWDARNGRPLPLMLAANFAIVLVWSWPPSRFLVPIQGFLTAYLLRGVWASCAYLGRAVASGAARRSGVRYAVGAAIAAALTANLGLLVQHARVTSETGFPLMHMTDPPASWHEFEKLFGWVQTHSGPDDKLAAGLDSMAALYTRRTAFRPYTYRPDALFYGADAGDMLTAEELTEILLKHRPRFLLQTPMPGFAEEEPFRRALQGVLAAETPVLRRVYAGQDERFAVYELAQ